MSREIFIQAQYPGQGNQLYFDTASAGLLPQSTIRAAQHFSEQMPSYDSEALRALVQAARMAVSDFLKAPYESISFVPSMGYALLQVTSALQGRKRVLLLEDDYPSLQAIWQQADHEIHIFPNSSQLPMDYDRLFSYVKKHHIEVLVLSHVHYVSGRKVILELVEQFCLVNSLLFIVDATQSFGLIPYSFHCSTPLILLASCYKWICAGYGLGICYLSAGAKGWLKQGLTDKASVFEISQYNYDALIRLQTSLQVFSCIDMTYITKRVESHTAYFLEKLDLKLNTPWVSSLVDPCGIITTAERPGLYQRLKALQIRVARKGDYLRTAIHFYNTLPEIDVLLSGLNEK